MNVYDFDGTIYNGDSSVDIYFFLLKRYPKLIAYFPKQILGIVKYKLQLSSKEEMKEMYFSFLKGVRKATLGVRHHKEKINISKEFINKTKER